MCIEWCSGSYCMAKMIDQKPEYKGEAKFWQAAHDYLSDDVIIYHNREVKGREFDFCLLFENLGVLIVEEEYLIDELIVFDYIHLIAF